MKINLVLHNIRSTYNFGAILRTAEGLGITSVITSGWTPSYDDKDLLPHLRAKLDHQIAKSALGAERMVPQEKVEGLPNWLEKKREEGAVIVGLENNLSPTEETKKILLGDNLAKLSKAAEIVLILGEEVEGIPQDVRKYCDYFLEIPMRGQKESFNVSIAAAIALWELSRLDT